MSTKWWRSTLHYFTLILKKILKNLVCSQRNQPQHHQDQEDQVSHHGRCPRGQGGRKIQPVFILNHLHIFNQYHQPRIPNIDSHHGPHWCVWLSLPTNGGLNIKMLLGHHKGIPKLHPTQVWRLSSHQFLGSGPFWILFGFYRKTVVPHTIGLYCSCHTAHASKENF